VAFTASSNGGSTITDYKWSIDGTTYTTRSGTTSPIVITGLTNGTPYTVRIRAVNAAGDGAVATAGATSTPRTTPSAPTITAITAGNGQLSVAFTAGADGGSAITNYKYSIDGGALVSVGSTSSLFIINGLTNGQSYAVRLYAVNSAGDSLASSVVNGTPLAPSSPTITVAPATFASDFSTTYGTASSTQTFTVSGSTLNSDLTVTAPAGLEISLSSGSGYAGSLTLSQTSGAVSSTTIYARLKATAAAGSYNSASIGVSGGGATAQSVATSSSGNTVAPKAVTITGLSATGKVYDGTTSVTITGTAAYSGLVNGESYSVTDSVTWSFPEKNIGTGKLLSRSASYTAPNANYSLSAQPTLSADITAKELTGSFTASNKVFDNSTTATVATRAVSGRIGSEDVNHTGGTATFADVDVANGKTVTLASATLTGADAGNYTLTSVSTTTANITQGAALITFGALPAGKKVGDTAFSAGATTTLGTISYSSSNTAVATVNASTGSITLVAPGVTRITAAVAGTANFTGDTKSQTLNVGSAGGGSQYSVDFEGASETKTAYTSGSVTLSGISWNMTDALIGTLAGSDYFVGVRSARLRGFTTSSMTMQADKANGAGTVSFKYRQYGSDAQVSWKVEYSTDQGANWTQAGTFTATSTAQDFSATVNVSGNVRFRIVHNSGGDTSTNKRANVDNFVVTDYPSAGAPAITASGTFSALSTTYGNASDVSATTATVTGGSLTADITATAPTGFQVSSDGMTYGSTATFTQTGGFANGTLYLRLAANAAAGSYNSQVVRLTSTGASDQTLAIANGTVNQKALTVSNLGAITKVYDGGNSATFTGDLVGVVGADAVSLVGTGTYASVNVGTGINVTSTATLTGAAATNYSLTQPAGLTGSITAVTLTGSFTASNKTYDGTTTATVTGRSLTGVLGSDDVSLTGGTATFGTASAGSNKTVTLAGASLSGAAVGNYTLSSVSTTTANIGAASLSAGDITITPVGDGSFTASATGVSGFSISYSGRTANGVATSYGPSSSVPTQPGFYTVTATSTDGNISGFGSSNYFIAGPVAVNDAITKPAGNPSLVLTLASLLANDVRITPAGAVATDGLSITGVTNGSGNSAEIDGGDILFTPSGSSPETFTYVLGYGIQTAIGTVTVITESSAPTFTLAIVKLGTAVYSAPNTEVTHDFIGVPNQTYAVEYSTDLTNWTSAGNRSTGATGSFSLNITKSGDMAADWNAHMFFRASLVR